MKTIIMVSPALDSQGGISSVIREYLDAGLEKRVQLKLISTHRGNSNLLNHLYFIKAFLQCLVSFFRYPEAIVHIQLSQEGSFFRKYILFLMARYYHKKIIVHLHGSRFDQFMERNRLIRCLATSIFRYADRVIVLSQLWSKKVQDITGKSHVFILCNPIRMPSIDYNTIRIQNPIVLFLGRLGARKGTYDLLECIKSSREDFNRLRTKFIIAGDGDVEKVRKVVRETGLMDMVSVPGWISGKEKEKLLITASILVLPSYYEQMPMSILEAMSYGKAIIATNIAGIPEMVEHGKNGFLITPGDIKALSDYLITLIIDNNLREQMGRNSLDAIRSKYVVNKVVEQLVDIYENI